MSLNVHHKLDASSPITLAPSDRQALARILDSVLQDQPNLAPVSPTADLGARAKRLYDLRRRREHLLPAQLFGEPAWDILLILFWAQHSEQRLSVSSVCAFASVPATTALRYIERLIDLGLITKQAHPTDRRIHWLYLSDDSRRKLNEYFERNVGLMAA